MCPRSEDPARRSGPPDCPCPWLVPPSGRRGHPRGCGNELPQGLDPEALREEKFVSLKWPRVETNRRGRKRTGIPCLRGGPRRPPLAGNGHLCLIPTSVVNGYI
jgi:hypothetical protein